MSATNKIGAIDWVSLGAELDEEGVAITKPVLTRTQCRRLKAMYDDSEVAFRSVIDMSRYNFGRGQYKYFAYPLPRDVQMLRDAFYPFLADIANGWAARAGREAGWPHAHKTLLKQCRRAGQCRPTPLMLRYRTGDYNCLHQDLYGPIHFPLQVILQLSEPGREFEGGELLLVEQRPRMQTRPIVVRPALGAAAIIPVRERPRRGVRGIHHVQMRHGVARVTGGERTTLGLIFHDAS
jgi:hypothetical protein